MKNIKFGDKAYGPGLFMSIEEAAEVKEQLKLRGTVEALRLAYEIAFPSDKEVAE